MDNPELWIVCENEITRWTFLDCIGNIRTGVDRVTDDEKRFDVSHRIFTTMVNVRMAIGYKLLPTCSRHISTDFHLAGKDTSDVDIPTEKS